MMWKSTIALVAGRIEGADWQPISISIRLGRGFLGQLAPRMAKENRSCHFFSALLLCQ